VNFTHDFVPSGAPVTVEREIVDVANCNQCHGQLKVHGSRFETKYCVMCHNPQLGQPDLKVFIHRIHYSANLPSVRAGRPYTLAGEDYSDTTLPLEVKNCRKCHNGEPTAANPTTQGNNWRDAPSREACGSCHDNIDWADFMEDWKNDPANKKNSKAGDDRSPSWRWLGCVYHDGKVLSIPQANIMKSLKRLSLIETIP
jgi:OmcA/MtrC family decaheme c-type cytochrome